MSKTYSMIYQCRNHFLHLLQIFSLITLEEAAQRGYRICILHSKLRKTNTELSWPCLERSLDQIISRDSFQPKSSWLCNLSGCSPPFLASNSETLLSSLSSYPSTISLMIPWRTTNQQPLSSLARSLFQTPGGLFCSVSPLTKRVRCPVPSLILPALLSVFINSTLSLIRGGGRTRSPCRV